MASSYEETHQRTLIAEADMILAGWAPVPAWMFKGRYLRFVQKFGAGYDKIDLQAARDNGVGVAIASGMNADPVAELVVFLILAVYRRFRYLDETIRAGQWVKSEMRAKARSLSGKTVGIVGLGAIGRAVSGRVQAFDAKVIYHNRVRLGEQEETRLNVIYCTLDELIEKADILSLHLPLTPRTRGLICAEKIARMKSDAIIINTARGELIVEDDLVEALRSGRIMGAGLDVFGTEPIGVNDALLELDNVVLTPHIGGAVLDNVGNMAVHCFDNMTRFVRGEPLSASDVIVEWEDALNKTRHP
ncbi:2-hydroxyacid dehydrogenase [Advenella kashmirensis]|nr:2-hydroxyacid dehydrogenase [Advenella kashmirensis]